MIVLSLLAKTCAVALWSGHGVLAGLAWVLGLAADAWGVRRADATSRLDVRALIREVLLLNASALVVGAAMHAACAYAAVRWKDGLPGVAGAAAFVLHAVGLPVSSFGGELFLTTMAGALRFAVSFDNLGVLMPAVMVALAAVFLLWRMPTLKEVFQRLGWLVLLLTGVAVARLVFATALFLGLTDYVGYETEELPIGPFFKPEMRLLTYLPLVLCVAPVFARLLRRSNPPAPAKPTPWPVPIRLALPVLTLLWLVTLWQPQGRPKSGTVLINTFHTQWSRTDRPYDRDWYGADSGYNYACLKRWFGVFYDVRELKTRITAADLDKASVLMVYLPDQPLSEEERRLIVEFVRRGGGLFLIGDHTNVFGSTSHLNQLCAPFGFFYRDDVLFDLDQDFFQLIDMPRWLSPFVHGMSFFKFRGPTSIQPTSLFTRIVLTVAHSKSLRAIYSVNNFYPPPHDDPKMMTGEFAVAVASRFGSGRVVAFADSTIFSNFEIFYPGKYEFLLNAVNWLNHEDSPLGAFLQRCSLLAALGLLGYLLARTASPRRWLAVLVGALLAAALAQSVVRIVEDWRGAFPKPVHPARALFFASTAGDPTYALRAFTSDAGYEERFDVFIQWVLRTGAFSGFYVTDAGVRNELYDHLRRSDEVTTGLALMVRTPDDLEQLRRLAKGPAAESQRLLLMFSSKVGWQTAGQALQESGLIDKRGLALASQAWPSGEVLVESNGRRLMLVGAAERFSDQAMGFSEKVVPNATQRALFDKAFSLVDSLFAASVMSGGSPPAATAATATPQTHGAR